MSRQTVHLHLDLTVACYLLGGVSRRWIKDKCKAGELEGYELSGNKLVVTAASINAFLENRKIRPASEL